MDGGSDINSMLSDLFSIDFTFKNYFSGISAESVIGVIGEYAQAGLRALLEFFADLNLPGVSPVWFSIALIWFIVCAIIIIKIKYNFWSSMPVEHPYDWWLYIFNSKPCILTYRRNLRPPRNPAEHIITTSAHDVSMADITQKICDTLIPSGRVKVLMTERVLGAYLGGAASALVSTIPSVDALLVAKTVTYMGEQVFVWNYICCNGDVKDRTGHLRRLMRYHLNAERRERPTVRFSLLHKEAGECAGAIPICSYNSRVYKLPTRLQMPDGVPMPNGYEVTRVFRGAPGVPDETSHYMNEVYGTLMDEKMMHMLLGGTGIITIATLSNMLDMIAAQYYIVYVLTFKRKVCGVYFFQDTLTQHDTGGYGLRLVGSLCALEGNRGRDIFGLGCYSAINQIQRSKYKNFDMLILDMLGHNGIATENQEFTDFVLTTPIDSYNSNFYAISAVFGTTYGGHLCLFLW